MSLLDPFSHVWLFATPWTVAYQAPLPMGFSRQEYWMGLPFPSPGDLPDPGIELVSLVSPGLAGRFFTHWATWEASHETVFLQITTSQDMDESHLSYSYFKMDFFHCTHLYWIFVCKLHHTILPREVKAVKILAGNRIQPSQSFKIYKYIYIYDFSLNFIYLLVCFWLCWVFVAVHTPSLVTVSRGYSSLQCMGF